jgi:hypothetical protein
MMEPPLMARPDVLEDDSDEIRENRDAEPPADPPRGRGLKLLWNSLPLFRSTAADPEPVPEASLKRLEPIPPVTVSESAAPRPEPTLAGSITEYLAQDYDSYRVNLAVLAITRYVVVLTVLLAVMGPQAWVTGVVAIAYASLEGSLLLARGHAARKAIELSRLNDLIYSPANAEKAGGR